MIADVGVAGEVEGALVECELSQLRGLIGFSVADFRELHAVLPVLGLPRALLDRAPRELPQCYRRCQMKSWQIDVRIILVNAFYNSY